MKERTTDGDLDNISTVLGLEAEFMETKEEVVVPIMLV